MASIGMSTQTPCLLASTRSGVAFKDESHGEITSWSWDFGDEGSGRDDLVTVPGAGRENTVVSDEVEPWRRHEGGELLQQFGGARIDRRPWIAIRQAAAGLAL